MTSQLPHGTGSWQPGRDGRPVPEPGHAAFPPAASAPPASGAAGPRPLGPRPPGPAAHGPLPPGSPPPAPPGRAVNGPWASGPLPLGSAAPVGPGGAGHAPPPANGARKHHGWYLVLAAAVLGVFVFCGIVVAAAGGSQDDTKQTKTEDVARNGALGAPVSDAPASSPAPAAGTPTASVAAPSTAAAGPATAPTTAAGGAQAKPTTRPPATKPATTKPATKPTTKPPAQNCNPNYSPCVPNDPVDVDCAGGSGNGPSYVQGPVRVIGSDPYGLDTDHDGIGCE